MFVFCPLVKTKKCICTMVQW